MGKLEHIGARIRLFRKQQNLTLEELAYLVHKSPSTLCKYESGSVNIDILTLSEIADTLGISINLLIDFKSDKVVTAARSSSNFFRRYDRFYVYNLFSPWKGLLQGVMDITRESADSPDDNVVLYLNSGDKLDLSDPLFIYSGTMTCDDTYSYFSLQNVSGMKDTMFILAKTPQWLRKTVKGLFLSVSSTYGCPSAATMLFSVEEQPVDDSLLEELRINSDEIIDFTRKTNLLAAL